LVAFLTSPTNAFKGGITIFKKTFFVFLGLCLLVAMTAQAAQDKTTIRLASPFKAGHILVEAGEKFKELVEKESSGRIEVQVQPGVAADHLGGSPGPVGGGTHGK
jgi:TRAP-type C4-dicarboxylate transport system substrate-binding protein